jgi:hypothetical protein
MPDIRKEQSRRLSSGATNRVALRALTVAGGSASGIALIVRFAQAANEATAQLAIVVFGLVLLTAILVTCRR